MGCSFLVMPVDGLLESPESIAASIGGFELGDSPEAADGSGEPFPPIHDIFHHADAAKGASRSIRQDHGAAVLETPRDPQLPIRTRHPFEPIGEFHPEKCGHAA